MKLAPPKSSAETSQTLGQKTKQLLVDLGMSSSEEVLWQIWMIAIVVITTIGIVMYVQSEAPRTFKPTPYTDSKETSAAYDIESDALDNHNRNRIETGN